MTREHEAFAFQPTPNKSPRKCRDECERLGLVERMKLGDAEYVRFTQLGHNVLAGLLLLMSETDFDDVLRSS